MTAFRFKAVAAHAICAIAGLVCLAGACKSLSQCP